MTNDHDKPKARQFLDQAWLVLVLAGVLGGTLALVERSLEARIADNSRQRLETAILDVVPEGESSERMTLDGHEVYKVTGPQGRLAGWAATAETMGFADKLRLLVGLSPNAETIQGIAILDSRETPGLGEKIRDDGFRSQFADQPAAAELVVVKPGQSAKHPIDAITGATISSIAVTRAVNQRLAEVRDPIAAAAGGAGDAKEDTGE